MKDTRYLDELRIAAARRSKEKDYWLEKLSGELEKCVFPYDYKKTGEYKRVLDVMKDYFPRTLSAALNELSTGSDVRIHIVLSAVLIVLLAKYTGKKDIIIGTPILRPEKKANFTNIMVALRNQIEAGMTYKELLFEARKTCSDAIKNQGYPIEIVLEGLGLPFMGGDFPLFDVALIVENIQEREHLASASPGMIFSFSRVDEDIEFNLEYDSRLYNAATAGRIANHFKRILATVLAGVEIKIADIDILSPEEKEQLLQKFNDTATPYPKEKTIPALFAEQVEKTPDNIAVIGTKQSALTVSLSYKQLNREVTKLAGLLIRKGVEPGAIVTLLAKRSIEMIAGIFAILKAGGAYLPMEPQSPEARKRYMLQDSKAKLLVATRDLRAEAGQLQGLQIEIVFIELAAPRRGAPPEEEMSHPTSSASDPAYIIYTSGTTGKPKGILTKHYNVTRVVKDTNYIDFNKNNKVLQLSNYAFDGSVFDIYGTLLNGAALVLVDEEKVSAADTLGELIRREKITVFFVTTALFNTLVEHEIECFKNVVKVLFGGERVSPEHSKKALEYMGKGRIIHVYGPTESAVYATYYPVDRIEEKDITIPIGRPLANTSLFVLGEDLRPLPTGVQGELYIGGDGLARGYMNRPELTAAAFSDFMYPKPDLLYKTGDLARWNYEGNIEFLGRIDSQVKVRGFRIELGEIESRLLSFPAVEEVLVLAKEYKNGDRYLCAYVVAKEDVGSAGELRNHLSQSLPAYMVPSSFMFLEKMPLTANGKIDQKALPEPEVRAAGVYAAPRDEVEKRMVAIWSGVLGIEEEKIGIDDNFFELGGHSIKATKLVYFIRKEFEISIRLKEVFAKPNIRELTQFIKAAEAREYVMIAAVEEKEYYELSYNQKRLWILHQLEPQSPAFNMASRFEVRHKADKKAFKKALQHLIIRHDSLRTKFAEVNDEPVQFILKEVETPFEEIDISALAEVEKKEKLERVIAEISTSPFNLTRAPLLRTVLIKLAEEHFEFIYNLHHIITDGWSMEVIKNEFFILYESFRTGRQVKPEFLELQYKDFCRWTNDRIKDPVAKKNSHSYWQAKLAGGIPALELPVRSSGDKEKLQGAGYMLMIDKELSKRLKKMAADSSTTLFVVMFSLYIMMLHRFSKQQDIVCSIIGAGREHLSLHNIIGFFVNSMLFRIDVYPGESFNDFLQRMQTSVIETFQNQGYPLELVCREMKIKHPDISISFNMLNILEKGGRSPDPFKPYHIEGVQDVKFDLEPYVSEYPEGINMYWVYKRSLFKPENIEHIVAEYIKILDFFTGNSRRSYEDFHQRVKKKKFKRR